MEKKSWPGLLLSIALVEAIGVISSLLSGSIREKYAALRLPPLSPPGWLFGVVWPVLFALMAAAAWLVYKSGRESARGALFWFAVQLAVNFVWPIIFFRLGLFWAAALTIVVLDALVAYTIYRFSKISVGAVCLMLPYLAWILFATYLNVGVAVLN